MTTLVGKILNSEYKNDIKNSVIFNVDEIAKYYWQSEKVDWNIMKGDFPNIAPPYEDFLMQYMIPKGKIIAEEGEINVEDEEHYAFRFVARKLEPDETYTVEDKTIVPEVKWLLGFQLYVYLPTYDAVKRDDTRFTIGIDETGRAIPIWGDVTQPMLIDISNEHKELFYDVEYRRKWVDTIFALLHPCLLAISFLHTKNTVIVSSQTLRKNMSHSQKRREGKRRGGEPYYDYHVLDIRPLREILRSEGVEHNSGIAKAAHLRRGHFRDYTEGRGLFGKIHSLLWFDSTFVKGTGKVDKEYNIKPPEENKKSHD
jgi:hypothetical protein